MSHLLKKMSQAFPRYTSVLARPPVSLGQHSLFDFPACFLLRNVTRGLIGMRFCLSPAVFHTLHRATRHLPVMPWRRRLRHLPFFQFLFEPEQGFFFRWFPRPASLLLRNRFEPFSRDVLWIVFCVPFFYTPMMNATFGPAASSPFLFPPSFTASESGLVAVLGSQGPPSPPPIPPVDDHPPNCPFVPPFRLDT